MRVTLVSYDDEPPLGGQGVVLQGMRAALKRRPLQVHTVSGRGFNAVPFAPIMHRPPLDFSLQINRNQLILYRGEPELIHAFGGPGGALIWRPLLVPLVYTAHHTYRQAYRRMEFRRALSPLERRAYRRAAKVVAVSASTANALMAMGIPAARIEVIANGVDLAVTDGAQSEPGRLLFVGRLEAEKGVLDALGVMESIVERRSDAAAAVVGTGRLQRTVARRAAQSGGRIEYLGHVDGERLAREYARASVVLVPSRYEGLGMVALEAQAKGTPVVGYAVDGLRDAVEDGGVLVRPGDIAALRAATVALLDDAPRRAELGARGRDRVTRQHSWDRVAERLENLYRDAIRAA